MSDRLRRQHYDVSLAMRAYEPTADKLLYCDTHQRIVLTFNGRKPCCIAADAEAAERALSYGRELVVAAEHLGWRDKGPDGYVVPYNEFRRFADALPEEPETPDEH